jgi:hypothetical protein
MRYEKWAQSSDGKPGRPSYRWEAIIIESKEVGFGVRSGLICLRIRNSGGLL